MKPNYMKSPSFFFKLVSVLLSSQKEDKAQGNQEKHEWQWTLLGTEDEAPRSLSHHCKNLYSRMREANAILINWVCRVLTGLLFLEHKHKTQDRGNHIITSISLWFGKMSGWLLSAARNDGDSDIASLSHSPYAFLQHFPPAHTPYFFKCNKHVVQEKWIT